MPMPTAAELIAQAQPAAALAELQREIRANSGDAKLRVFLFQLLAILGQWQRAYDQLQVCGQMDAGALAMVNTYSVALQCELLREKVFAGGAVPHVFGPPSPWVAQLAQALTLDAAGQPLQAAAARAQALEQAPASRGTLNGQTFEWLADADSRLGPVLEVIINGRYGWLPIEHVVSLKIEPVSDLRDLVWAPAQLTFGHGGGTVALLPVRYVGSTADEDAALCMARKTEWFALGNEQYRGVGQRILSSDAEELGLLEVRELSIDAAAQP